ncbi:MAG: AIR synthase-related protein [Candidatus Aenigmatarchaeota archaeon]
MGMKYSDIVDYDKLDPFKEEAVRRFRKTIKHVKEFDFEILEDSLGETAAVLDIGREDLLLAFGVEGLGTKIKVSEAMDHWEKIGEGIGLDRRRLFMGIGIDQCAMTWNDLTGVGAKPIVFEPIIATGSSSYFDDVQVRDGLLDGFEIAAEVVRVAIPGGETPTLKGIVDPETLDIAGGSMGVIKPKNRLTLGRAMKPGLKIYGLKSSGIHSNGLSLARRIADSGRLLRGYYTELPSGRTFGEAILTPTVIYWPTIDALFKAGVDIFYQNPITGHGFAKVMRNKKPFTYRIENLPEIPEEFKLMMDAGPVTEEEAYKTFNMGVGWVIFAPAEDAGMVKTTCSMLGTEAYELGVVEEGERQVILEPINVTYRPR